MASVLIVAAALLYQLLLLLLYQLLLLLLLLLQSVQHVMGQVTALAWALKLDPNLFTAGPEVLHAAKDAFTLAEREETLLLHKLVGVKLTGPSLSLGLRPVCSVRCCAEVLVRVLKVSCQHGLLDLCKQ
jgi:hypothetical protein